MASSDTGVRSNFSLTCTLLSQYIKENGGFGDLSLGLVSSVPPETSPGTLDLLPKIEKSKVTGAGDGEKPSVPEVEKSQLTIIYRGEVIVFNNFPADKANEIMILASNMSAAHNPVTSAVAAPPPAPADSASSSTFFLPAYAVADSHNLPPLPFSSDLPMARKHSLARFFAKRKDRISAHAPYQFSKQAPGAAPPQKEAVNAEPWLELCSHYSLG